MNQIYQLILCAYSPGNSGQDINEYIGQLGQFQEENPVDCLLTYSRFLLLDDIENSVLKYALTQIANILRPNKLYNLAATTNFWLSIPPENRNETKKALFRGLMYEFETIRNLSAHSLSYIVQIEYPRQWPDFYSNLFLLLDASNSAEYGTYAPLGAMMTLCEIFDHRFFNPLRYVGFGEIANVVLTVCESYLNVDNAELYIYTNQAMKCLISIFPLLPNIHQTNVEIWNSLFESTIKLFSIQDKQVHNELLYELTRNLFLMAYSNITPEIVVNVFSAIIPDVENEDYVNHTIQFWRSIADHEKKLMKKKLPIVQLSEQIAASIDEFLLALMTKIPKDIDPTDNYPFKEAAQCLYSLGYVASSRITMDVLKFFETNIESEEWNVRGAAINAITSVLKFPIEMDAQGEVSGIVRNNIQTVLSMINDKNDYVRESALYFIAKAIGKFTINEDGTNDIRFVAEYFMNLINGDTLSARYALMFVEKYSKKFTPNYMGTLEHPLERLLPELWPYLNNVFQRPDVYDDDLIRSLKQTIRELCYSAPSSLSELKFEIIVVIFERFVESTTIQYEDNRQAEVMQGMLSQTFQELVFNLRSYFRNKAEFIKEAFDKFLDIYATKTSVIGENILSILGILVMVNVEEELWPYFVENLLNHLISLLNEETSVFSSVVVIGDLFRDNNAFRYVQQYAAQIIETLIRLIGGNSNESCIQQLILSLSDITYQCAQNNYDELVLAYREDLFNILCSIIQMTYKEEDPNEVFKMSYWYECALYISSSIIVSSKKDTQWLHDNRKILFEVPTTKLKVDKFYNNTINMALCSFLERVSRLPSSVTKRYNVPLNHNNTKTFLKRISADKSKKNKLSERASDLLKKLPRC